VFDSKGQFVRKIGSEGVATGQFKFPRGVCVDQQGNIIVADRNNDRVCMFNDSGRFMCNLLTKDDGVKAPYGISITIAGHLVITESGNSRAAVKVFQL
jgi:tripartite motif-containing protein 2/3